MEELEQDGSSQDALVPELLLAQFVSKLGVIISEATELGSVVCSLHCLASLLRPNCPKLSSGAFLLTDAHVNHSLRELEQLAFSCRRSAQDAYPAEDPVEALSQIFYQGSSFTSVAKILISRVATDWLVCFPLPSQLSLFDDFFICAPPSELLLTLMPALTPGYYAIEDNYAAEMNPVCEVAERLLILCLIEKNGLKKIALDYAGYFTKRGGAVSGNFKITNAQSASSIAQIIASIPDKVRLKAPPSLHSPFFYHTSTSQFLAAAEDCWRNAAESAGKTKARIDDGMFLFIGVALTKFCRRGHADVVASQMLPGLLQHVKHATELGRVGEESKAESLSMPFDMVSGYLELSFWPSIVASMEDPHALERLSEALLLEMATACIQDWDAYCILWILFSPFIASRVTIRALFTEKFLLWKVFPICCLRWILHFAVLCCPPRTHDSGSPMWAKEKQLQKVVVKHIVEVWAEETFIQSVPMQQQAYLTAAVGILLKAMSKGDLESSSNILQSLLQGLSRRLESPLPLVRQMAKRVAFALSVVINPSNPLFLDENDQMEDLCDWEELGLDKMSRTKKEANLSPGLGHKEMPDKTKADDQSLNDQKLFDDVTRKKEEKARKKRLAMEAYDPDEVIDLETYITERHLDEETGTDSESETSLQPYDLSDDESDLERGKIPVQLSDCAANLRKRDEPDKVERALEVLEKLVRAMPDELGNSAADLAHALIHVRCSEVVVERKEQSAEDKRHDSLVALLACAPLAVIGVLTKELYSPHVDVSQRVMILEVMSDAATELHNSARGRTDQSKPHLIELSAKWYGPGSSLAPVEAGPWREAYEPNDALGLIFRYERDLPLRPGQTVAGKPRRWGHRSMQLREEQRKQMGMAGSSTRTNKFSPLAAAFMLPVMREYDKKRHGVDLLGRDFIVLGRLIYMLGVCIECIAFQPEAPVLAAPLLDMLKSRQISGHREAYVRRSALFAASRIILALHPSYVARALSGEDFEIAKGLDWIREWTLRIANDDSDSDCSMMATACLQLHSELALQALRSMELGSHATASAGNVKYKIPGNTIILP
eukprot:c25430_g1_i1 orf=372-3560(-)